MALDVFVGVGVWVCVGVPVLVDVPVVVGVAEIQGAHSPLPIGKVSHQLGRGQGNKLRRKSTV